MYNLVSQVGECKLFIVLELIVRAFGSDASLTEFPMLHAFYNKVRTLPPTQRVLENGGKFPRAADNYFLTYVHPISISL